MNVLLPSLGTDVIGIHYLSRLSLVLLLNKHQKYTLRVKFYDFSFFIVLITSKSLLYVPKIFPTKTVSKYVFNEFVNYDHQNHGQSNVFLLRK